MVEDRIFEPLSVILNEEQLEVRIFTNIVSIVANLAANGDESKKKIFQMKALEQIYKKADNYTDMKSEGLLTWLFWICSSGSIDGAALPLVTGKLFIDKLAVYFFKHQEPQLLIECCKSFISFMSPEQDKMARIEYILEKKIHIRVYELLSQKTLAAKIIHFLLGICEGISRGSEELVNIAFFQNIRFLPVSVSG